MLGGGASSEKNKKNFRTCKTKLAQKGLCCPGALDAWVVESSQRRLKTIWENLFHTLPKMENQKFLSSNNIARAPPLVFFFGPFFLIAIFATFFGKFFVTSVWEATRKNKKWRSNIRGRYFNTFGDKISFAHEMHETKKKSKS